ncbi:MAG: alpha/beta hydrolase [Propionibacteriaceae bacterium]
MHTLKFLAEVSANGVVERDFIVDGVPGVIWSPTSGAERTPIVLLGHGGGLHKKTPAQVARAHQYVTGCGYHVVAIDAPGHGDRPRSPADERARAELRQAMLAGDTEQVSAVSLRYGASLAERAVPEWQATLDALQELPEIGHEAPIGYGGGITLGTGIGIPLTAVEPRIRAAIFGGGFAVDDALIEAARKISVPVQFLLPWDDEHVDRQSSLALFDAFASEEKTLHANPGDHRTIRWFGLDTEFLPRHLGRPSVDASSLLVNADEQGPRV